MEPPDPFPNSEVKRLSADGSVVRPCESRSSSAPYLKPLFAEAKGGFVWGDKRNNKRIPKIVVHIAVRFLVPAVLPLPYGYYTLLCLIAFGVFGWAAYISFAIYEKILPWIFIALALVYNLIIKVYFPKEI